IGRSDISFPPSADAKKSLSLALYQDTASAVPRGLCKNHSLLPQAGAQRSEAHRKNVLPQPFWPGDTQLDVYRRQYGSCLHELDLQRDGHVVADENPTGFKRRVPGQAEVLAVNLRGCG